MYICMYVWGCVNSSIKTIGKKVKEVGKLYLKIQREGIRD